MIPRPYARPAPHVVTVEQRRHLAMRDETPAEIVVTVDPDALCELERRARTRGIGVTDLASEILRRETTRYRFRATDNDLKESSR